jgi:hypothetical protein
MKKVTQITIALIMGISLFSSCAKDQPYMNGGKTITTDRNIDTNYTGLIAEGAFDIQFLEDQNFDLRITCPQNKLSYITTTVNNGVLYITEQNNNVNSSGPITIYVNKAELESLINDGSGNINGSIYSNNSMNIALHGSGNFNLDVITAETTYLWIDGAGNMNIEGESRDLDINIDGSGNINALSLPVENCFVAIEGSGNALVNVSNSLNVTISGSGNVEYLGSPSLQLNITGSGEVKPY